MTTYLASVLIFISMTINTDAPIATQKLKNEHLTEKFEYKVKTFKVKELEYKRVPTKWIKETPAN